MRTIELFFQGLSLTLLLMATVSLRMRCIRNGLRFDMEFLRIEACIQMKLDAILAERRKATAA